MTSRLPVAAALVACVALTLVPSTNLAQNRPAVPDTADMPPGGYGTLGQGDISIQLRTDNVAITVMPLDERVIRLLAPDTYESMHRLRESRRSEIEETARRFGTGDPVLFFVSFFGLEPRTRFDPEGLTITSQNRFFRPLAIIPISRSFSDRQINQRETATAVYLYQSGIRLLDPLTVSFEAVSSQRWESILRRLDRERSSVEARAAAARRPGALQLD